MMMGHFFYGGLGLVGMILGLVITIGVVVGLVLLVVWGVRRMGGKSSPSTSQSAKEIAQIRYARGEINREQFLLMLKDIE